MVQFRQCVASEYHIVCHGGRRAWELPSAREKSGIIWVCYCTAHHSLTLCASHQLQLWAELWSRGLEETMASWSDRTSMT